MATGKRPGDDTLVYLNQVIGEGRSFASGSSSTFDGVLAQVDTQRGGAIVEDGLDYYVGLQRLVLNTPLPILIGEMALPSTDGVSLVYSLTISGPGGVEARAFFERVLARDYATRCSAAEGVNVMAVSRVKRAKR